MRHLIITVAALILPLAAFAGVYKCEVNGKTIYQQTPCSMTDTGDTGIQSHGYQQSQPAQPYSGLRPGEIDKLREIQADKSARRQARQAPADTRPVVNIPKPTTGHCRDFGCKRAELERVREFKRKVAEAEGKGYRVTTNPAPPKTLSSSVRDLEVENQLLKNKQQQMEMERQRIEIERQQLEIKKTFGWQ